MCDLHAYVVTGNNLASERRRTADIDGHGYSHQLFVAAENLRALVLVVFVTCFFSRRCSSTVTLLRSRDPSSYVMPTRASRSRFVEFLMAPLAHRVHASSISPFDPV